MDMGEKLVYPIPACRFEANVMCTQKTDELNNQTSYLV